MDGEISSRIVNLFCDNQETNYFWKASCSLSRTKHVKIDFHFVHDRVLSGEIYVEYILIYEQLANIMTKSLGSTHFSDLRTKLIVLNRDIRTREDASACNHGDNPL